MKFINRATALAVVLTLSAVSAWAQAKECTDDFKTATYSKWYDNRKDKQDVAYEAAKEYLSVCTTDDQYSAALKKFVADYDKINSNNKLVTDFDAAVKAKNYADQVRLGKQLVAMPSHADNAVIYILMAGAGLGDANLMSESAQAAKKAIELIEAGKPVTPAYQTKDQALAAMNYLIAKSTAKTSATDAIPYFVKALRYESELKKSPIVYNELGTAYGEGPVDKYAKEYKMHADAGKTVESPEIKLAVANLNQAFDRQIDAFARAAAVSSGADKKAFMDLLAAVYKDRHKKDAAVGELDTMVASSITKPIPDAPTAITTVPTTSGPAPTGTSGTSTTGTAPSTAGAGMNGGVPSTNPSSTTKPAPTGTGTGTAPAKPTATPKPKQRR
ncbi:MAG TPA: hypothetical protein VFX97_07860 [Pyrinomonadaceae bacterium]|nr:hypothetical protein [Pyrinomonadaceae bacterium]